MKVLARRVKSDGRRLNLGVVELSNGSALGSVVGQDFSRSIVGEKRTSQTCNSVEPLHSVNVKDDKTAVDALLYLSGHSNFQTVN